MKSKLKLLYVDLFCGAGGTTTGVENAYFRGNKCAKVIACVNHDPNAIVSHAANHPGSIHFTEDIRTMEMEPLASIVRTYRRRYPKARVVLWASLECTNFSKAKGGLPRDADSRTLADHLFRYIEAVKPDYIQIENVAEFMSWGELDEHGKPVDMKKGSDYIRWVREVCSYGYKYGYRMLNAADFGAYTSRTRYFGQFARKSLPIVFPKQSYSKNGKIGKKWKAVRDVLDLDDEGVSIFGRKKPLVENTLKRIYAGLLEFADDTTDKVQFLSKYFSGDPKSKNISTTGPCGSVTCKDHHSFITAYYGHGFNSSVDKPAPTIPTKDRFGLVQFFANDYSGGGQLSSIDKPSPSILTTPKQNLVSVRFLYNPQYKCVGSSIDKPCFTLIASMDKRPPSIVSVEEGTPPATTDEDSPMTAKIKAFMLEHNITDIRMRMLNIAELKRIQGFSDRYILCGTQAEQKRYIGNAVEVNMSRSLCEALAASF